MKKFRSKWFRVAVEGATTDGRQIERSWIEEMAASYNPKTYGARIWMEHIRSAYADGPFKAYGDVLAVKAEEVEIGGEKRMALFAQIEPTNELVKMVNELKQKVFTSIEVLEKFAGTGKAYLMGLAVTDTPASLGTEMLAFAAQNPDASPLKSRKQNKESLFSAASEVEVEFEEIEEKPSIGATLFAKVQGLLKRNKEEADGEFAQIGDAVEAIAEHVKDLPEQYAQAEQRVTQLSNQVQALQTELADLKEKLGKTADHRQQQRPPVTGGGDRIKTDC